MSEIVRTDRAGTVRDAPPARPPMRARAALAASDGLNWAVAIGVAVILRYELDVADVEWPVLFWTMCGAAAAHIAVGAALGAYRGRYPIGSLDDAAGVSVSVLLVGVAMFGATLLASPSPVPRSTPLIAMPIAVCLLVGTRVAVRFARDRARPRRRPTGRRALVHGSGEDAFHLVRSMLRDPDWGIVPVAMLDDSRFGRRRVPGVPVRGTTAGLADAADRFDADMLVIALSAPDDDAVRELSASADAAGMSVLVVPPLADLVRSLAPATDEAAADRAPALRRPRTGHPAGSRGREIAKRSVDIGLCVLGLPVVLPVLLAVAVVLAVAQGQVFYPAPRIGRHGRPFTMFKFATMRPGDAGPRVTRENDPRITPVGAVLRATKLNELPQVLNVLRGDMSIVGPRPEDPRYARSYDDRQRAVWSVRPGMTGMAYLEFGDEQAHIERVGPDDIEAYYLDRLLPEKLAIELDYVRTWSVPGDVAIVARTMARLLRRR